MGIFRKRIPFVNLVVGLSLVFTVVGGGTAVALSGSEFKAGRIIDDGLFYNGTTMSATEIQSFINAKVPSCDTWGEKMYNSTQTRAQYGASRGYPTPYTCLKDYRQDTGYKAGESGLCSAIEAKSNRTAAQIIDDVARACHISQKAILVMLQKEQGLVTDDWPWSIQYRSAMGYGCPDTAACDSEYYGFFNQVYNAARQFQRYKADPNNWNHVPFMTNQILYQANASSCGSRSTYIENYATAGLYNYTPYTPNQAALDNLYGTGDSCSAYGNRNFWRYYSDWFGSPNSGTNMSSTVRIVGSVTSTPSDPVIGETATIHYTIKNYGPNQEPVQTPMLQCRLEAYGNCDSPHGSTFTLAPNQEHTFTHTIPSLNAGRHSLIPYFMQNGVWYQYGSNTASGNSLQLIVPGLKIVSPITASPVNPAAGESVAYSFTIKNAGPQPVPLKTSILQCRRDLSVNCDSKYGGGITINPGEKRTFTYYLTSLQSGSHAIIPYFMMNDTWYRYGHEAPGTTSSSLAVSYLRLTSPIVISPTQPVPGQPTTVTYTVKNFGSQSTTQQASVLQCRLNTSTNCDSVYDPSITFAAGEQRTFIVDVTPAKHGSYSLTPYFSQNNSWYRYGSDTKGGNTTQMSIPQYVADTRLVSDITATPAQPIPGQPISVSYTVKNFGDKPAIYQSSILQCRFNTNTNCDPSYDAPVTINAGDSRTFTVNFPAVKAGSYTFKPYYKQNDKWHLQNKGLMSSNSLTVSVPAYVADMRLVGSITSSPAQPTAGQTHTVSYTVKNFGDKPAIYQSSILQCRFNTNTNCDPSYDAPVTINAGDQRTFTVNFPAVSRGSYTFKPYYMQNNAWHLYGSDSAGGNILQLNVD